MRSSHVVFTYLSLFIFGFIDNARGPIYPRVIEVFGLTNASASWVFTLTSLVNFCMTLAMPLWLSRLGAVKATKLAMFFHTGALLCMGTAGLGYGGFELFLIGSAFLGLAMGIQSVTVNLIIAKVSTPYNASKLFSGLHSMYGAASLIVPLAMGIIFQYELSWQWFFLCLALMPLSHLLGFFRLPTLGLEKAASSKAPAPGGAILKLGIIFSFYVATEILVSSRLVAFLYESAGMEIEFASYCLTGFFALLLGGRLVFSFYRPPFKSVSLLRLSAFMTLAFYLLALLAHPVFITFTGLSISYFFPFGMDYIKQSYPNSEGIIAKVMMFVGAMLAGMHFLFGLVSNAYGIQVAMWIGVLLTGVVLVLLLLEKGRR